MSNPKIKITPTSFDKLVDLLALCILIFSWIFLVSIYPGMPDIVPIHLDGYGKADGFGNKISLFIGPVISTIIYVVLSYLNNFPHIYNYPSVINEDNALHYYTNATRMIRYLKLSIMIVFLLIDIEIVLIAKDVKTGLGIWSLMIPLVIIFVPVIYFIIQSFTVKKS